MSGGFSMKCRWPSTRRVSFSTRATMVPRPGAGQVALDERAIASREVGEHVLDADAGMPEVEDAELGEAAQSLPIAAHHEGDQVPPDGWIVDPEPSDEVDTGSEPLEVPFPGAGQGLVEVVDVEHVPPFRGLELAEVGDVRIAARLDPETGHRRGRKIGGHDRGSTTKEGERRDRHPPVAEWQELRHARGGRLFEDGDRVAPVGLGSPRRVRGPGSDPSERSARVDPLGARVGQRRVAEPVAGSHPPAWPTLVVSGPAECVGDEARGHKDTVKRDARRPARRVEEVDEVLGGEIPGRARSVGAATGTAGRRIEAPDAGIQSGRDIGECGPPRVVEVERHLAERQSGFGGQPAQCRDLARHADPDRVAEADLVDAQFEEAERDVDRPIRRHPAGIRTAERGRHVATAPPPEVAGARQDRRERGQRLVHRHPDVRGRERVGRGREDRDGVGPGRLGAGEAAEVRDEDRVADARHPLQAGHERICVGELWDRAGGHEARRFDLAEAGRGEQFDEPGLDRSRDRRRLVLEAVAGPDLVDPDVFGHPGSIGQRRRVRSDERRVHRPLETGDLDLDPAEQLDRRDVLRAAVRRCVPTAARLAVQGEQFLPGLRQGRRRRLVLVHSAPRGSDVRERTRMCVVRTRSSRATARGSPDHRGARRHP